MDNELNENLETDRKAGVVKGASKVVPAAAHRTRGYGGWTRGRDKAVFSILHHLLGRRTEDFSKAG
jgi:hypothetical protein